MHVSINCDALAFFPPYLLAASVARHDSALGWRQVNGRESPPFEDVLIFNICQVFFSGRVKNVVGKKTFQKMCVNLWLLQFPCASILAKMYAFRICVYVCIAVCLKFLKNCFFFCNILCDCRRCIVSL